MSIPGWESDRPLTVEIASTAIRSRFPAIDSTTVAHIGSGWEFDAYSTADGWVFRFPRREHVANFFERESRVHHLLSAVLPASIRIPRVELIGEATASFPYTFAGHRLIAGRATDTIDEALLSRTARTVGRALGVHALPEHAVRAAGITEPALDEPGRVEWIEARLRLASSLTGIDPAVDDAVRWARAADPSLRSFDGPVRFIHNDLSPDHLLVDPTTGELAGILDWTDATLGDAARDFVVFVAAHGWRFADEVIRHYPHPVDQGFRERLDYMARLLSVMWLAESLEQESDVSKHVRWVRNAFAAAPRLP